MELTWGTELDDELALQEIKDEYHHSVFLLLAFPCVIPIAFFGMMTLFALVSMVLKQSMEDLPFFIAFAILLVLFLLLIFILFCLNSKRVSEVKSGKFQYRRAWIVKKGGLTTDRKKANGYLWFEGRILPAKEECVVVPREVYDSVDVGNEMYLIYLKPPDKTFAVRAYKEP